MAVGQMRGTIRITISTCRWHPEIADCLATGGRDKNLKIWNTSGTRPSLDSLISTLGPVGQVRWRPTSRMQIASSSIALDMAVNIWDIRRPHVPNTLFDKHQGTTAGIQWKGADPNILLSLTKVERDE